MRAIVVLALAGLMAGSISGCFAQSNNDSPQARKAIQELLADGYSMPSHNTSGGVNGTLDGLKYKATTPDRQLLGKQSSGDVEAISEKNAVLDSPSNDAMIAQAKEAVFRSVKDGESMRINILSVSQSSVDKNSFIVCGEVNAKNSYGAYSGFQRFAYSFLKGEPSLELDEKGRGAQIVIDALCRR